MDFNLHCWGLSLQAGWGKHGIGGYKSMGGYGGKRKQEHALIVAKASDCQRYPLEPHGWGPSLEAEIGAWRLELEPGGWNWSLEARTGAWTMGLEP